MRVASIVPYRHIMLCVCMLLSALACSQEIEIPENADTQANLLAQAEEALAYEDFQRAVRLYTKILSGDTDQILAYTKRADAYIRLEQYENALEDIDNVLTLDPENLEAYYLRGATYTFGLQQRQQGQQYFLRAAKGQAETSNDYFVRGKAYFFLGQPEQAVEALNEAITLDQGDAFLYYWRARVWQSLGDGEGALADYTEALRLNPEKAAFYYDRGNLFKSAGHVQEAIRDFSSAIAFAPDNAGYYFSRGQTYAANLFTSEALHDFTQAITLAPDNVEYVCVRGEAYELASQDQAALADYTSAIMLNPDAACGYLGRGGIYTTLGDYQQALIEYNEFQQHTEQVDASFYRNRAAIYENLGHYGQALDDYTKAIQLDSFNASLAYSRGMLYAMLEDFDNAAKDCNNALLLDDGQGTCLANFCLGVVHSGLHGAENYRQAREYYAQALNEGCYVYTKQFIAKTSVRIGIVDSALGAAPDTIAQAYRAALDDQPDNVYAHVLLGDFLRDTEAIAHYNKAIAIEPEYAVAYLKRGMAHSRAGRTEQARADFQHAKRLAIRSTWRQKAEAQLLQLELSDQAALPTPLALPVPQPRPTPAASAPLPPKNQQNRLRPGR